MTRDEMDEMVRRIRLIELRSRGRKPHFYWHTVGAVIVGVTLANLIAAAVSAALMVAFR